MPQPYTQVGGDRQQLRGDCKSLPFICDNALDYIYSSHLLEDFSYGDLIPLINEWRRCLKPGGLLIINCPDQQKFLAHCAATGQGTNPYHKEPDFSIVNFKSRVLANTGGWEIVFEDSAFQEYSWLLVAKKI
jgi:predicted SAM-dependent methyltransferase